ncbi:MAG TPA: ABC transporter ATP-binding protein [Terracidiphilus sp.]|jgi:ABC-type lipoprotein export system ATPase subunit|nr:ABC transporter ATP-binding protein [Terracidiphilus sp.]
MTNAKLQVRGLSKSYDGGRIEALRGVDLSIAAGEYVAITGPSGSGKSTLLHLLGGLDSPTSGDVLFADTQLGLGIDLDTYRSEHVGFIFQAFYLMPTLRAVENVQVPMLGVKRSGVDRSKRAHQLLKELGVDHRANQYPSQLSAGERQRVAIARALANEPQILLADEPTGNLDSVNTARTMEILTNIQRERGMTLIIVTHEDDIAHAAPRRVRMRDGKIEN